MNQDSSHFSCSESRSGSNLVWQGPKNSITFDPEQAQSMLSDLSRSCYVVEADGRIGITGSGEITAAGGTGKETAKLLATAPPCPADELGDPGFLSCYGVKYAYYAGSMANGISSEEMVAKLGREKILASFGAAGLHLSRIEKAIRQLQIELPGGPYAFNLINHQGRRELEQATVELYLKNGIKTVEASAFLDLDSSLVYYRDHPEHADNLLLPGTWGAEIIEELKPQEGDVLVEKSRYSAFYDTNLDTVLKRFHIKYIIAVGLCSNCCVEALLRDAYYRGYFGVMVSDATAACGPEFMQEASLFNIKTFYGWTVSAEEFFTALT